MIYPLDYATIKGGLQRGVQIVINLSCQEIQLQEGWVLGQFQQMPDEEIKVTQEGPFWNKMLQNHGLRMNWKRKFLKGDGRGFYHLSS